jgi:peptidoglycan/xylan/chitin deacetylase (PgdA/CDA1 family)
MYIQNYIDIPRTLSFKIRDISRSIILDILSFGVEDRNKKLLKTPRVQFVYLHHIFEDEIEIFDNLIFDLKKIYEIIPFSEAVNRVHINSIDRPYLAFSSDDGFKSNLNAHKVFLKHNISACFFLCTDFIGLDNYNRIKEICENKFHLPPIEFLNKKDIKLLIKQGHEIGSHTTNHSNLKTLNYKNLNSTIKDSFAYLKNLIGFVKHFSFPYGTSSHFPYEARSIVNNAGYVSCVSAIRGCHLKQKNKPDNASEMIIKRDILNVNYNFKHVLYFMVKNIKNAQK